MRMPRPRPWWKSHWPAPWLERHQRGRGCSAQPPTQVHCPRHLRGSPQPTAPFSSPDTPTIVPAQRAHKPHRPWCRCATWRAILMCLRLGSTACLSASHASGCTRWTGWTLPSHAAKPWPWWASRAAAKARWRGCWWACTSPPGARCSLTAKTRTPPLLGAMPWPCAGASK